MKSSTINSYREHLFPRDTPRFVAARKLDAYEFGREVLKFPPVAELVRNWEALSTHPFTGITSNGTPIPGLFHLAAEGAPTCQMVRAAEQLLSAVTAGEREKLRFPLYAPEWRRWSNPEFLMNPNGLRLDELAVSSRHAVLEVIRASLSTVGYAKARGCMLTNAFLGEICDLPRLMNEWSYNFLLFGSPSEHEPWGWSIYGHHLALSCLVLGSQMVVSPTFMGAEPNVIDCGPHAGLQLFDKEESVGLSIMRNLSQSQRKRAVTYTQMHDPSMPQGRWNIADQRHLAGAFQDNRIIPYEGIPVSEFDHTNRVHLMDLVSAFIGYLPAGPLAARIKQVESMLDQSWWSWIGGYGDEDPYYYRIQSPVILIEFDHHSGVWLSNQEPAKCHIHTIVRTPNGNDYGRDLLRQHYAQVHPGHAPGQI